MTHQIFQLLGRSRWADSDGREFPDLAAACLNAVSRARRIALGDAADAGLAACVSARDGATLITIFAER